MRGLEDPQNLNKYAYVNNSPITYNDPSGHFKCVDNSKEFDGDCRKVIEGWLAILETKGGDEGKALVEAFRDADTVARHSRRYGKIIQAEDQITITIVDDPPPDPNSKGKWRAQYATNGANTFTITASLMKEPESDDETDLANAGVLGHEIDHMMHPALSGTKKGEAHAWHVQYRLYQNMGIDDNSSTNGDVNVAVFYGKPKWRSDKELRNSYLAKDLNDMPFGPLEKLMRGLRNK